MGPSANVLEITDWTRGEEEVVEAAIIIANIDGLLVITFMQNIR